MNYSQFLEKKALEFNSIAGFSFLNVRKNNVFTTPIRACSDWEKKSTDAKEKLVCF